MVQYLSEEQIVLLHALVISETGGANGIRDPHAIKAFVHVPRQSFGGKELYPDIFQKAAVYVRSIIKNHPFIDGNKRTTDLCPTPSPYLPSKNKEILGEGVIRLSVA